MFLKKHRLGNLVVCLMVTIFLGFGSFISPMMVAAVDETPIMELVPEDEGDYKILADPADLSDNTIGDTVETEPQPGVPDLSTDTANNEVEEDIDEVSTDSSELIAPVETTDGESVTEEGTREDSQVPADSDLTADIPDNNIDQPIETELQSEEPDLSSDITNNEVEADINGVSTDSPKLMMQTEGTTEASVTITGDGVANPITFTLTELEENLELVQVTYSTINTWPTKNWYVGEGVKLSDLLEVAEITEDAKLITVNSRDGYTMTFTKKELLDDPRYYFPGLKENHEFFGYIPGSPDGAEQVDAILALVSASDTDDPDKMDDNNAPLLMFGQRWITEQTNHAFAKIVSTIEVSTMAPDKWTVPTVTPASGTVEAGTGVVLQSVYNDADKVYYTTDGTDPTYRSPMYNWIASRWWKDRKDDLATVNHPIEITKDTIIKARTIGLGSEDSDIVTFEYKVPVLNPAPDLTADITGNEVGQAVDITFATDATWEAAITEITVNDSALTGDQYKVSAGNLNIDASVFTVADDYAIVVKAIGYADATVTQTIVAAPPVFTIEGNAVTATSYTMAELQAMPATTKTFGTYVCKGVDFKYLLESLGVIDDPSWTMKVKTVDFPNGSKLDLSYALDPVNNCLLTYERDGAPIDELSPLRLYYGDGTGSKQNYKYVTGIMITKLADPPALVADVTDNKLGQAVDISFTTDATWEAAITEITVNDSALTGDQYKVSAGNLNIDASVFTATGDYAIVVKATGYEDATVTQTINEAPIAGAEILLSSNSGIPGVTIFISGSDFDANTAGTIWFDTNDNGVWDEGEPSAAVKTDEDGAVPLLTSLTVPSASTGSYTVQADIGGIEATANFTITDSGIIVSPTSGNSQADSRYITVTGNGFLPSKNYRLFVDRNGNGIFDDSAYKSGTTTSDGTVSVNNLSWPASPTGIYNILLDIGSDDIIEASASIGITPGLKITTPRGNPGTKIGMTLVGFSANETGYVWFDANGNGVWDEEENQAPVTTSNSGGASSSGLIVPSVSPGSYQICTEIPACGLKTSATYTVTGMILNPSSGTAGTNIAIKGYGYAPNKTSGYYIWFDTNGNGTWDADETKVEVTTDASGNLHPAALTAPAVPAGNYNVCASFVSPVNFAVFTVNGTTPEPATYVVTFAVTPENATVVVKDSESVEVVAEADGTYNLEAGEYSYTVTKEGYKTVEGTIIVEATDITETIILEEVTTPEPKTWYVGKSGDVDYNTIQAAVTAAGDGDTIIVKDGTYTENVVVDKILVIQSENGADVTIVQANDPAADVFKVIAANVTIDGFTASMGKSGIELWSSDSSSCTIKNNKCSGNAQGIGIEGNAEDNIIANNTCTLNNKYGIYLTNTTGNSITDNICSDNPGDSEYTGYGLCLFDNANNNTISGNISDLNREGIRVKNARTNSIYNNTFSKNNIGVNVIFDGIENVFYLNNFVDNATEIAWGAYGTVTGNFWNSPTQMSYSFNGSQYNSLVGNYWSGYSGADADGNGIGDTPYQTVKTDNDNYPLMGQWNNGVITGSAVATYTVTFEVTPEDATVVVKDSESAEVTAEADGTYNLEAGEYSYTVSADGYVTKTGDFTVAEADQTVTVVLEAEAVVPATYTITFAVTPEDATLVVKDSEDAEVTAEADGTYNLEAGEYSYTVSAEGYVTKTGNFTVADEAQTVTVVLEEETVQPETPQYKVTPAPDAIYTIGETADGIQIMTVNDGQTGFKYFEASIEPVKANEGTETAVFTHVRNDVQLGINASVADFEVVNKAKAGFNVNPGDVVKVYIVDQLTNDTNQNPIVLQ